MKKSYVLKTLWVFFLSIFLVYSGFVVGSINWKKKDALPAYAIEQAVYLDTQQGHFSTAIRIEIEVMDDVAKENGHVLSVEFAGNNIPLKPVDPTGKRGTAFLRLLPGSYPLQWQIQGNPNDYPPSKRIEKTINIQANDIGVYLLIKGDQLFIQNENQ